MRIVLLSLVLVACSHDKPAPAPPAPAPQASASKRLEPPKDISSLALRLQYEAAHRPHAGPATEAVLDALDASGLHVEKRRQYLGVAMHASYCAGGTTRDGVAVSVCEYASDRDATAAKAFADQQYAALTSAVRATRGGTLLTVVAPADTAQRAVHTLSML